MITITHKGDFSKTKRYLTQLKDMSVDNVLDKYGRIGVAKLQAATPKDSGKTAGLWNYIIEYKQSTFRLVFTNSNINDGVNIAIILQYGHGTGTGGWVEGRDYINPAVQSIFDELMNEVWKEVESL